jgi:hypothetical protein
MSQASSNENLTLIGNDSQDLLQVDQYVEEGNG